MRRVLNLSPLENIESKSDTKYVLKFVQQPLFARESTKSKRLLQPHPIISLNVFVKTGDGTYSDVTSHNLSSFFLKASVIETNNPNSDVDDVLTPYGVLSTERPQVRIGLDDDSMLVGNSVINAALYNIPDKKDLKIINSKFNKVDSQSSEPSSSQKDLLSEEPKRTSGRKSLVYPSFESLRKDIANSSSGNHSNSGEVIEHNKNNNNGVMVFLFNDLGIVKRGTWKLKLELFKVESFQHHSNPNSNMLAPQITKLNEIISDEISVYGSRQFYKKENQIKFHQELKRAKLRLSNDCILNYLKRIRVLRETVDDSGKSKEKYLDEPGEEPFKKPPVEYPSKKPNRMTTIATTRIINNPTVSDYSQYQQRQPYPYPHPPPPPPPYGNPSYNYNYPNPAHFPQGTFMTFDSYRPTNFPIIPSMHHRSHFNRGSTKLPSLNPDVPPYHKHTQQPENPPPAPNNRAPPITKLPSLEIEPEQSQGFKKEEKEDEDPKKRKLEDYDDRMSIKRLLLA